MNVIDRSLTRSARMLALAGIASLAFGVLALAKPGLSLVALLALFGAYALVNGLFLLGAGLEHLAARRTDWVPYVLGGLAGLVVGGITFFRPRHHGPGAALPHRRLGGRLRGVRAPGRFALWDETHGAGCWGCRVHSRSPSAS